MSFSTYFIIFEAVVLLVDAALIALTIYIVGKAWEARPDILGAPTAQSAAAGASRRSEAVQKAWGLIEAQAARGPEGMRLAVIDADRLADKLLKDAGYEGEGALERMKRLPGERVATAAGLMHAHRFRNRLVHEVGFSPDERDLKGALAQYRAFLSEVGYL
jgi:hypothetical protein